MSQPDVDAMAAEVVTLLKDALAPVLAQQATHQAQIAELASKTASPEIAPDDIAASVAGLLRKELADLEIPAPRPQKRIVRDGQGAVKYQIEETH